MLVLSVQAAPVPHPHADVYFVLTYRYEKGKILIFVDKQEKCDSLFR